MAAREDVEYSRNTIHMNIPVCIKDLRITPIISKVNLTTFYTHPCESENKFTEP